MWQSNEAASVTRDTTSLALGVSRLGCSAGEAGRVLIPKVSYEPNRMVIETDVEPRKGAGTCPGNVEVGIRLELDEPVGDRDLIDGACTNGDATATSFCADPVRWPKR